MQNKRKTGLAVLLLALFAAAALAASSAGLHAWSPAEIAMLRSLWLGSLPPLPSDPTNAVADDPRAARLGQRLFFDTRFSANGEIACASCHKLERNFTDGLPLARGTGTTTRNAMTIIGTAYSPWYFWDGRKDSQWSQALGPLESAAEHGGTRMRYVRLIAEDEAYRSDYQAIFGSLPELSDRERFPEEAGPVDDVQARHAWEAMAAEDREAVTQIFANMGKAIAAYERKIMPGPSRFDAYVESLLAGDETPAVLNDDEIAGLRLFIGKGQCTRCHNGPLFTNNDFHNTGIPAPQDLPLDHGRMAGIEMAWNDELNCLGPYSDGETGDCAELRFARRGQALDGAFKTPTLRNVAETGPYMHAGQFVTLKEVLAHYNEASPGPVGHNELEPLGLSETELEQLEAFLRSLSGPLATGQEWLSVPE